MGSSKKHKEKDRDRDHKRKKHRRSRSRSRSRERKSRRHHSPENPDRPFRDGRGRDRYPGDFDYHHPPPPPQNYSEASGKDESGGANFGKEKLSLSIEDTNKLRAKLGLKPLEVDVPKGTDAASSEGQDVHAPPVNWSDTKRTEKLREKFRIMQEKRKVASKLSSVKGLGDSDSDDGGAAAWVQKNRKSQKEKEMAERRARMLEEMDMAFGVGNLMEQEFESPTKEKTYTSHDLRGLKVEHDMEKFKEGSNIILTLKDKGVLDEDEADDVLVNINIIDDERAEKNVENKKKRPDYKPYDEADMDEYGMMKEKDVLDKYDEEIHGVKKESFVLGSGGKYNAEQERNMAEIRKQLKQQGQSLKGPGLKVAKEFLTPEEMAAQAKFKKVRKKVRRIRKKDMLKADDLLPLPNQMPEPTDYGSRSRGRGVKEQEEIKQQQLEEGEVESTPLDDEAAFYTGILPETGFKPPLPPTVHLQPPLPPPKEENDDLMGPDEDLSGVAVEEESLRQELQASLNKTRRLQHIQQRKLGAQRVVESMVKQEPGLAPQTSSAGGSQAGGRGLEVGTGSHIVLNSISEFCRSLGEIPTYGLAGNRDEEREEIMDLELELMEQRKHEQEMEEQTSGWAEVDIDTNPVNILGEETSVLDEEPIVTESIGSALKLAMKKGYLEGEDKLKPSHPSKTSMIQAQNYSIEDKRYDDLDEKFRKRDRYGGGMITDFKDKDNYKPEIHLEYVDEAGRALNPKEAFRQLSHRFHGKGSGKKKTEKRMKKVEEEQLMKHMSSTDTPLNTLSMLQDKQRSEKSPYVILSGNKTFSSNSTTLSKPRH